MRDGALKSQAPATVKRTRVVIAGGGVAGLAAARALRLSGIEDFALLELEDTAGGNSRAGMVNGIACPLGAHYLPVPDDNAREVQDLLEELGLRRRVAGRWEYDERNLCHSPQERLFFRGEWQDGLLPVHDVGESTHAQYRKFAQRIDALQHAAHFAIPTLKVAATPELLALDAVPFERWLDSEGFSDPATALVPRLLLPRRLRRRHRPCFGLGRHPLFRKPARVSCAGFVGRRCGFEPRTRRRAHLARGQRLAHPAARRAPG